MHDSQATLFVYGWIYLGLCMCLLKEIFLCVMYARVRDLKVSYDATFFLHVDSRISDPDENRRGRKVKDIKVKEKLDLLQGSTFSFTSLDTLSRLEFQLYISCILSANKVLIFLVKRISNDLMVLELSCNNPNPHSFGD